MEESKYSMSSTVKRQKPSQEDVNQNKKARVEGPGPQQPQTLFSTMASKDVNSPENIQKQRHKLPVYKSKSRIVNTIRENATVILIGETASGKTTQVPQFLLEAGMAKNKMIAITQPRRVAAITLSERVAAERNSNLGEIVGFAVRFEEVTSHKTKVKFLTDGLLLREAMLDPLLQSYNVIILDEAHERTLATDVLFGVVKAAQRKRANQANPLKIVVMSATMNVDQIRSYFAPKSKGSPNESAVPVVWVEGRTYDIEICNTTKPWPDYLMACLSTLFKIHSNAPINEGILIFLTGQEEIEAMANNIPKIAKEQKGALMRVLPLYSALAPDQQALAFRPAPPGCRKVVLATNVAETSVTISGVIHVIDSGMVKARTHFPETGLDVLKVQRISQAQAWQRTGRAGREAAGKCYRCYTKIEFQNLAQRSEPEIRRVSLTTVVMQLLAMHISRVTEFDFMDKPKENDLENAVEQLKTLGAIENMRPMHSTLAPLELKLTDLGKVMAGFPLDARFSKVLISSDEMGCMEEMLSLVALLSGESVMMSSLNKRAEAEAAHTKFYSQYGDHETLLIIYRAFTASKQKKLFCTENYLSFRALQQAVQVREQLEELCVRHKFNIKSCGADLEVVRRCLMTGLFGNLASHQRDKNYLTVLKQHVVLLHPSSVLFSISPQPPYVLYTELVQTGRSYMRQVSVVEPEWLLEINPEFARRCHLGTSS